MFELASPWVLCLVPLPWLIWFFLPPAQAILPVALRLPFFKPLQHMIEDKKQTFLAPVMALSLSWCALVLALAGPRWVGEPTPLTRDSHNIMMALDISPSMEIPDMVHNGRRVTRLLAVKEAATRFVMDRVGDKLGLILFGEKAYLMTPLTYDRHNVVQRIDDATVGLAGKSTSIGDALGLAIKRLEHVPPRGRMIILLTDGVSNSGVLTPMKAAELARMEDIQINTIGLHSDISPHSFDGMFITANNGQDLDEKTLKSVAKTTGGRYFRATDEASLERIYAFINSMSKTPQEDVEVRPQYEYYPWLVALGLLLLLYVVMSEAGIKTWGGRLDD